MGKPTFLKLSGPRSSPGLSLSSPVSKNLDEGTWGSSLSDLGLTAGRAYDISIGYNEETSASVEDDLSSVNHEAEKQLQESQVPMNIPELEENAVNREIEKQCVQGQVANFEKFEIGSSKEDYHW